MSVYIVKRQTGKGPRWHVRYAPGRYQPVTHLGAFETERLAKQRRHAALEALARGEMPSREPAAPLRRTITVQSAAAEWYATLHDLKDSTLTGYKHIIDAMPAWLATMDPALVTHGDIAGFAAELTRRYKRGTAARHIGVLRMILDHAERRPNPEHHMRVRLPRQQRKVYRLPTRAQIAEIHRVLPHRAALMTLLEHTGLRIEEAATLRWRDIDYKRERLLVQDAKTAAGRRWVERLPDAPPFPTGTGDGLVFANPSASSLTGALAYAHRRYGTYLFSAHEFRHLAASRWLHDGILSPAQIAARLGHASPAITLEVYSHLAPPDD